LPMDARSGSFHVTSCIVLNIRALLPGAEPT
jgi:hypothetical protein